MLKYQDNLNDELKHENQVQYFSSHESAYQKQNFQEFCEKLKNQEKKEIINSSSQDYKKKLFQDQIISILQKGILEEQDVIDFVNNRT